MTRLLADNTLIVFLSDCHIGGDNGRDIFESPDDLAALFHDLAGHTGPVDLVLAGDFFDCLRIGSVSEGENRASATISRPEYRDLFTALRSFAAGKDRTVLYLPGNHDAEVWWNAEIRAGLERQGLVHGFALSYAVAFASDPNGLIYCEHGNEFDPSNLKRNYDDPFDTPLGDHIVTEIIPRLPSGWAASALQLDEIDHVFPLDIIPEWTAGRLFYALVTEAVRWLLLPLMIAYAAFETIAFAIGAGGREINHLFVEIAYDIGLLLLVFGIFFFVACRLANRSIRSARTRPVEADVIRARLERGERPPLAGVTADAALPGEIAVFVSGHTHAPALAHFDRRTGGHGAVVNSGCWLRQLHERKAHLGMPRVFVDRFVQTHVRVYRQDGAISVELWEHPRPTPQRLRIVERLAVAGRLSAEAVGDTRPKVRARVSVGRS